MQRNLFSVQTLKCDIFQTISPNYMPLMHACTGPALLLCTLRALLAAAPTPLTAYFIHHCLLLLLLKVMLFIVFNLLWGLWYCWARS